MTQPLEMSPTVISDLTEGKKPFVLFFTSEYCDYCKALGPALAVLNSRYQEKVGIYLLDVDVHEDAANVFKDHVKGVPSVLLFYKGKFVSLKDPEDPDPFMWYRLSYLEDFIKTFLREVYDEDE